MEFAFFAQRIVFFCVFGRLSCYLLSAVEPLLSSRQCVSFQHRLEWLHFPSLYSLIRLQVVRYFQEMSFPHQLSSTSPPSPSAPLQFIENQSTALEIATWEKLLQSRESRVQTRKCKRIATFFLTWSAELSQNVCAVCYAIHLRHIVSRYQILCWFTLPYPQTTLVFFPRAQASLSLNLRNEITKAT